MSKTTVTIKVSPGKGKGGAIIARQVAKVRKGGSPTGKPLYHTKAQLNVHLTNKNGERRR